MMISQIFVIEGRSFIVTIEETIAVGKMPKVLEYDIRMALKDLVENEWTVPDTPDFPA